jgi:hypothetical protein
MANTTQQTLTIRSLERLRLSALGNPSVRVTFSNGLVAQTVTDGQVGSMIENSEYSSPSTQPAGSSTWHLPRLPCLH